MSTKLTHSLQNRSTLVRVVLGRPTAACSYSSYVFISDRHSAVYHRALFLAPFSFSYISPICSCWLKIVHGLSVLVHGTTEPYLSVLMSFRLRPRRLVTLMFFGCRVQIYLLTYFLHMIMERLTLTQAIPTSWCPKWYKPHIFHTYLVAS